MSPYLNRVSLCIFTVFILPVKFTQNRQNKQQHFYSTGKIARRLSSSIVGWNIHMARSQNQNIFSGLHAQQKGVNASDTVNQRLTPQNIVIFSTKRYM